MKKLHNIEDYFMSAKAYYVFLMGLFNQNEEWKNAILDKKYLCGAKINFISNLMLSIKEELVDKKEGLVYESRLFLDALEYLVDFIADRTDAGYRIGDYVSNDASTIIALIRNKFAHGDFYVDFDNNMIVMNSAGTLLKLDVDKLVSFIVLAFFSSMKYQKRSVYEHDVAMYEIKDKNRKTKLKTKSEVKNLIKSFHVINFRIVSLDESDIDIQCIELLDNFLKYYHVNPEVALKSSNFEYLNQFLKLRNCTLSITSKRVKDKFLIEDIYQFAKNEVLSNDKLDYIKQLDVIGSEVQRRLNSKYNVFSPMLANIKNLILLSGVSEKGTTDMEILSGYFADYNFEELKIHYDELGVALIAMFNALFIYPIEDVYTSVGGYKVDRCNEFDFSKLDVSMINPSVLEIDYLPLDDSLNRYNSLVSKKDNLEFILDKYNNNLENVTRNGNDVAKEKIKGIIANLEGMLSNLGVQIIAAKDYYDSVVEDFMNNNTYFKNRAIVEGIRNSVAHGNYQIVSTTGIMDTRIIFNDYYEEKCYFKLDVRFYDFIEFLEASYRIILDEFENSDVMRKIKIRDNKL